MGEQFTTDVGQVLAHVHYRAFCVGRWCVVHAPMPGPWEAWLTQWREDRGIMERVCPCGTGHPVAEDYGWRPLDEMAHDCCGCPCSPWHFRREEESS